MRARILFFMAWIACFSTAVPAAERVESRNLEEAAPSRAAVREFVDRITIETEGQVARFHEPVCVVSRGLPPAHGAVVEERIREIAGGAGIAVDRRPGCLGNVIVLVANQGEAAARVLRRERPDIFRGLAPAAIGRALAGQRAVHVWQSSETRRAEGAPIADGRDEALRRDAHLLHGVTTSLLRETTRRDLRISVILFDVDALDGLTLTQIADHAAMRGLAPTRSLAELESPSILTLFSPASANPTPTAATRLDIAYLQALYRTAGEARGSTQRGILTRSVERSLQPRRGQGAN